ncbi:MAG TPA: flagellar hook-basal body complex protein FliE [Bacteroidales bacterium]|nr:flagellar hook-basal body complex protein FliE [Bacteroidales bacterium]
MIEAIGNSGIIQQKSGIELSPEPRELKGKNTQSFSDVLSNAIHNVDGTIRESHHKVEQFLAGETDNVHDVMIAMQRAKMSFDLMVEVRNKAIQAYQEISNMQI